MKVLGIDPGYATIGWGLLNDAVHLSSGAIVTSKDDHMGDRLLAVYNSITALVEEQTPDYVAIEQFFYYRMGNAVQVAQARGVIIAALAAHGFVGRYLIEPTANQVKKHLTGKGNAHKSLMRSEVQKHFGFSKKPSPDDIADALAIALLGYDQVKRIAG